MSGQTDSLYKLQTADIEKAGLVLAGAFENDPVWSKILKDLSIRQRGAIFEFLVRYCNRFGTVYAPSENLEGIAAWIPGHFTDITFRRILQSRLFASIRKMGIKVVLKSSSIRRIFMPMEKDRRAYMAERAYIYLMVIGVSPEHQGQGFGKSMLHKIIEESENTGLLIYLETGTPNNVEMYQHFGFDLIKEIEMPLISVPQWEMVREPT